MKSRKVSYAGMMAVGFAVIVAISMVGMSAPQATPQATNGAVRVDNDDLGGVVTSTKGPEAGVWVIAETADLPTKFSKTVVTDDRGRYLVPDLPRGNYNVWVRGYGLVDSSKVRTEPGKTLNLTAVIAPNERAAAQYYPSVYWFSLMKVPDKSEFPGTGANGIHPNIKSQAQWLRTMKTDSCMSCHQLGGKGTREIPEALGQFESSEAAWRRRVQSGQAGAQMVNSIFQLGQQRAIKMLADWTDRIKAGEVPPQPPRPQGVERNVVITQWDWADPKVYLHDLVSTDRRNPRLNANGPVYGSLELAADYVPVLDPVRHTASKIMIPVRDANTPSSAETKPVAASAYWGDEAIWDSKANAHNPMMDQKGRLWLTSRIRGDQTPAFCQDGALHPSAKLFPVKTTTRNLSFYDQQTKKWTLIDTCFSTHHLMFAEDANHTLWTSGGAGASQVIGWLNTKMFDETGDEVKSQGWAPLVLDTNGNGKVDAWTEPNQPVDSTKDMRIAPTIYGVAPSPDGSVWGTQLGFPGRLLRITLGSNPPSTTLTEAYELPADDPKAPGFSPRGLDVDRNNVAWLSLASGHLAGFDRRKCTGPLNGPNATGKHCPEGWTLYPFPGPQFQNVKDSGSAEASYFTWVDQFDTSGLGRNTPIATGNGNDALLALQNGKFVTLRVPYPTGFFAKWTDGRIDNPGAGWKGKGLWTTWATRAMWHSETGAGTASKVVKFQVRPDPLAK